MWLVTPVGFFSIVQKPGDDIADTLTIRARARGDLEALREHYLPSLGPIITNAGTDYRYRAQAPRADIARAMQELVETIDYDNFKNEVHKRQGSARAHAYHKVWNVLYSIGEPEPPKSAPDANVVERMPAPAFGGVLIDEQGRILLRKPRGEYDGYVWTFAKGRPDQGETAEQTALREVQEETGYDGMVIHRLPGRYRGGTTVTEYFVMNPRGDAQAFGPETEAVRWATMDEAMNLVSQTRNAKGRARDLRLLQDVSDFQFQDASNARHLMNCHHVPRGVDVFCMVNGKPSNREIFEEMLEGEMDSPEARANRIELAMEMGVTEEEAVLFWG